MRTEYNELPNAKHLSPVLMALMVWVLAGCAGEEAVKEEVAKDVLESRQVEVTTEVLKTRDFEHELVSNGNLSSEEKADLKFQTPGTVTKIFVRNGEQVEAGDLIAMVDTFIPANQYRQACDMLEKAKLGRQEALINLGYKLDELHKVPADVLRLVELRSGYNDAVNRFELSRYQYEHAFLRAPVAGTVVNLFQKPFSDVQGESFCNIISNKRLEVVFSVLENELPFLKKGDKVNVSPYAQPDLKATGRIVDINPVVDKDGMVRVTASVDYRPRLFYGMNVKISVLRNAGKKWVVPKSAVVLRSERPVVFALKEGKAAWNYVELGLQNSTSYTITSETLKEGDVIIVGGNENLADQSPVAVKK